MVFVAEINTSIGVLQCELRRKEWHGAEVISIDLWQSKSMDGLDNAFINFRAGVTMQWEVNRYRIIDKRFRDANELWRELENLISNLIIVNE